MSQIFQYNQYTKKLMRLIYVDNNVGELIYSHGNSWLDTEKAILKNDPFLVHPFKVLPFGYDKIKKKEDIVFVYNCGKKHLEDIVCNHQYKED